MTESIAPPSRLLVAVGGNATHPENIAGTADEQKDIAAQTAAALLPLMLLDNELIITHGNGPVVGKILMRQSLASERVPPMPLDICVAHSQGGIAYLLMQAIENTLRQAGSSRTVACLLTRVEVDGDDPAFTNPTKLVGPFFTPEAAKKISDELGWVMKEDSGRGMRHVVPSPKPKHICDVEMIRTLTERGTIVIAGGGGGIPVLRDIDGGTRSGVEAVIDKDLTSALMANVLNIKVMMILTAVSRVAINFNTPEQRDLDRVSLPELRTLHEQGHFPPGSMGPKIEAAFRFLEGGGERFIIGDIDQTVAALHGEAGTHVFIGTD